ncbi:MAG TPA: PqqD family protein [Bacteroidia bacterium]|nr:PqqD family protein [Bacteroidia bacterium]
MHIKKNLALSDTGFVFDPSTGNSYSTNPIGLKIIQDLKQGKNEQDILKGLASEYQASNETLEKDLMDFMSVLKKLQLSEQE